MHEMVIDGLIDPNNVEDITPERLENEGMLFLTAGTETTGRALAVGILYIYSSSKIRTRLRKELQGMMKIRSAHPSWTDLEKNYLIWCVQSYFSLHVHMLATLFERRAQ